MIVKMNKEVLDIFKETSGYGAKEQGLRNSPHTGIDLNLPEGTDVLSPVRGVIERVVDYGSENIGKGIIVKTHDGKEVIFGHLSEIDEYSREGNLVFVGQKLGESGNTGHSTGAHLHIGVKEDGKFIDPSEIVDKFQKIYEDGGDTFFYNYDLVNNISDINTHITNISNFITTAKQEGFWYAMTEKHFLEWLQDVGVKTAELFLTHNDVVFLLPAVGFLFATFLIGTNKTTKWILPAFLGYFVSEILYKLIFQGGA